MNLPIRHDTARATSTATRLGLVIGGMILAVGTSMVARAESTGGAQPASVSGSGQIALFVFGTKPETATIRLDVGGVLALPESGSARSLDVETRHLDSHAVADRQLSLASGQLPAGSYRGVEIDGDLKTADGSRPFHLEVAAAFGIEARAVTMLELEWALSRALAPDTGLPDAGAMSLRKPPLAPRSVTLFALDGSRNRVLAIDREKQRVFAVIGVGARPRSMAVGEDGRRVYVADSGDDTVSVIDTASEQVVERLTLPAGSAPESLVLVHGGRRLAVSCPGRESVAVFDPSTSALLREIRLPQAPGRLAAANDDRSVYVLLPRASQVAAVDSVSFAMTRGPVAVESEPSDVAVQKNTGKVYVAHAQAPVLSVLDAELRLERRLQVGATARRVALEGDSSRLYLSGGPAGGVGLFSPAVGALVGRLRCPASFGIALDPDGKLLYVAGGGQGTLYVLDRVAGRLSDTLQLGGDVLELAVVP